jgi:nicotinic acid phosphoribosyltransferase
MIPTTLYDEPQKIIDTMYQIDREWIAHFPDFAFLLPDTYGTSFYFKNCPKDIFEKHIGCRFDSKDPFVAIPEYIDFIIKNGGDPLQKI